MYVIDPPELIVVPPVPATSKFNAPPDKVIALLILIFPPVLGTMPKAPELIVNAAELVSAIVSRSAASIEPAVE